MKTANFLHNLHNDLLNDFKGFKNPDCPDLSGIPKKHILGFWRYHVVVETGLDYPITECVWVKDIRIVGRKFEGEITNDPIFLDDFSEGDFIKFDREQILEITESPRMACVCEAECSDDEVASIIDGDEMIDMILERMDENNLPYEDIKIDHP